MRKVCFLIIFCLLISGCESVKNDMPVQLVAEKLGEKISNFEHLGTASADYIKYCMQSDLTLYAEYTVLYPFSGTKYNEIGIFKVKSNDDLSKGLKEVKNYLLFKKSNWDTRYNSQELSKINNAKICHCGNYILYTILAENEESAVIKEFKTVLKK